MKAGSICAGPTVHAISTSSLQFPCLRLRIGSIFAAVVKHGAQITLSFLLTTATDARLYPTFSLSSGGRNDLSCPAVGDYDTFDGGLWVP